jgi:8-amino-7-oxononanoate synthase
MTMWTPHTQDLDRLDRAGRRRQLAWRKGLDFSSNDYLGLAGCERLASAARRALARGVPIGSGGSRLLRGNHPEHEMLEEEAARFFGSASALFFSSGYAANAALLSTLPQRGDLVIHDALIHASAHEGLRLGRAEYRAAVHNDAGSFADTLEAWRKSGGTGRIWIAVESLYSMDGDRAPLDDLVALAARHEAILLIDEAHATGVFGPSGRGLAAAHEGADNVITLRTCGKAMGCEGALLCGPKAMRDFLINRGRAFIFSTAPSPLMAAVAREALRVLADQPERRIRLHDLIDTATRLLGEHGVPSTGSQIVPIMLGDEERTMRAAARLRAAGFDIRGIRPPTVPPGTSRLRVSLTLNVGPPDIEALADAVGELLG